MKQRLLLIVVTATCAPLTLSAQDWDGFYAGGQVVIGGGESFTVFGDPLPGNWSNDVGLGIFGGYNRQLPSNIVVGGEITFSAIRPRFDSGSLRVEVENMWEVRGRIGYAVDGLLPYLAVGYANGSSFYGITAAGRDDGYSVAAGVEYRLKEHASIRVEYSRQIYSDALQGVDFAPGYDITTEAMTIGVAWHF
jgi:opacity protein-like surface antigen